MSVFQFVKLKSICNICFPGSFADTQLPSKRIIGPKNFEFLTSKRVEFEEYLKVCIAFKSISSHGGNLSIYQSINLSVSVVYQYVTDEIILVGYSYNLIQKKKIWVQFPIACTLRSWFPEPSKPSHLFIRVVWTVLA